MALALEWLASQAFLSEVRHLCWTEPFENGGTWDEGWHCRDQALLAASVLAAKGHSCAILEGKAAFVRGPGDGEPPCMAVISTHAWIGIDGAGFFDGSPRLTSIGPKRQCLDARFECILGNRCMQSGRFEIARTEPDMASRVDEATHRSELTAIYLMELGSGTYANLSRHLLENAFAYVNSPLTDRLRCNYAPRIYAQAAVHLFKLLRGERESLRSCSQDEAWLRISEQPGDPIGFLASRGGFS